MLCLRNQTCILDDPVLWNSNVPDLQDVPVAVQRLKRQGAGRAHKTCFVAES